MQSHILFRELLSQLQTGWAGLPDKPEETPQTTLMALLRSTGALQQDDHSGEFSSNVEQSLRILVEQRLDGVPLAYLTGRQVFMEIEFLSSPEAMIPRKETEILGKAALGLARQLSVGRKLVRVIDLCTGSGNIALTVAHFVPECQVTGADLSGEAVQLAQRNAMYLGLANRAQFLQGDLFAPFESEQYWRQMDLITCNPPYISSAQVEKLPTEIFGHEPRLAFDGGPFGIKILTRLVREASRFIRPGGWLCFEVGLGQGKTILNLVSKVGAYQNIQPFLDEAGEIRALQAQLQADNGDL